MKKIGILFILFLLSKTLLGSADSIGRLSYGSPDNRSNNWSESAISSLEQETNGDEPGFFRDTAAPDPGGTTRPNTGDAIGQEAVLTDGLPVLIACCIALALIKCPEKRDKIGIIKSCIYR